MITDSVWVGEMKTDCVWVEVGLKKKEIEIEIDGAACGLNYTLRPGL